MSGMSGSGSPEQLWGAYLDAVETAARAIARQAADGGRPEAGEATPAPPLPTAPWPAELEARRQEVLEALAAATATVERCRDEAGGALAALVRPAARPRSSYLDGASVDVVG